jgi:hypothetical protein
VHYHTRLCSSACTLAAPAAAVGPCTKHEGVLAATCCCWVLGSLLLLLLLLLLLGVLRHEGFHARLPAADEVKTR